MSNGSCIRYERLDLRACTTPTRLLTMQSQFVKGEEEIPEELRNLLCPLTWIITTDHFGRVNLRPIVFYCCLKHFVSLSS